MRCSSETERDGPEQDAHKEGEGKDRGKEDRPKTLMTLFEILDPAMP